MTRSHWDFAIGGCFGLPIGFVAACGPYSGLRIDWHSAGWVTLVMLFVVFVVQVGIGGRFKWKR